MTHRITPLIVCCLFSFFNVKAQTKVIGECTIQYSITQLPTNDTVGTKWVYIKGNQCKTVLTTPQLVQTLLFNAQDSIAVITKDIGASHFLQQVVYPPNIQPNLLSMKSLAADSIVQIVGYECKGISLQWSDGTVYKVWYATALSTTVNTFELAFKEVPGLVLSYEIVPVNGKTIKYIATKIDLSPIPINQYNINREQYQIID